MKKKRHSKKPKGMYQTKGGYPKMPELREYGHGTFTKAFSGKGGKKKLKTIWN